MANEATKLFDESSGDGTIIQDFTVADGTGISKGSVLKLTDPRTAAQSDGAGDVIAGIAARDKVANDGRTQLSVYKKGYFQMTASGSITIGEAVKSSGADNKVATDSSVTGAANMGYAQESASDGETFELRLDL